MQSAAVSHLKRQHLESSRLHLLPRFSVFTGLLPSAASALLQPLPSQQLEWSLLKRSQTMAHLTGKALTVPFPLSGWCCLPCDPPPSRGASLSPTAHTLCRSYGLPSFSHFSNKHAPATSLFLSAWVAFPCLSFPSGTV